MTTFTLSEAADLVGVSSDTVRRWIEQGRLPGRRDPGSGRWTVAGADLAEELRRQGERRSVTDARAADVSMRNRLRGVVTRVVKDTVMAQVELQAGPFRVVSLISREAVDELGLEVGSAAVAAVKATNVSLERDRQA
ncbi:molybdopterin-binding protein [Cellulosimicrobium cellulans]|jgi:molybdopterin-binding protein|uniref:TOBE domain-containing protein n=1 Tax=Cellulosimicrobium cellulans TaxID=1710 RepID=UPI00130DEA0E|nr:TOBE domain-containing protein [Cellulosimicrobium cellulans]